jgi:hypothetical protein
MMRGLGFFALSWLSVWGLLLLTHFRSLMACWKEPVLKYPVLILESDDWGAGPLAQADALGCIAHRLSTYRDQTGHSIVMTLGIVLEVPDGVRIAEDRCKIYHGLSIDNPIFSSIKTALIEGENRGIFALHLHGMTHYRAQSLIESASGNTELRSWMTGASPAETEHLPDALQSNWIDGAHLPASKLTKQEIDEEVRKSCAIFRESFGAPRVAVATTFIWDDRVEEAWAAQGLTTVTTPGRRYTTRNVQGQPDGVDAEMQNGMSSPQGLLYLVRDVYFEPARGHDSQRIVKGVEDRTLYGRPTLVETHRFNYLGSVLELNLNVLCNAVAEVLARWPTIRFLSSEELASLYRMPQPGWFEDRMTTRLSVWARRCNELPRFRKLARLSGFGLVLDLLGTPM